MPGRRAPGPSHGFTLVELLVVVLIIGILAAIALPRLLGQRTRTKNAAAQAAVRHALVAARSYYTQNAESYVGLGPTQLQGYESSLGASEPADTVKPGDAAANPQNIWIGNGLDSTNPNTVAGGDPNGGSTVVLCSVSRGDAMYCVKDVSGVATYLATSGCGPLYATASGSWSSTSYTAPNDCSAWPPNATSNPAITGTPTEGQSLSGNIGSWSASPEPTYEWKWVRCDSTGTLASCNTTIPLLSGSGATVTNYTLVAADVGSTIRLQVTATNTLAGISASSSATAVVSGPPSATSNPTISGSASKDQALSGTNGSWTGTAPLSYSWKWVRCDSTGALASCNTASPLLSGSGATIGDYTLVAGDIGSTIRLQVTAANIVGSTSASSSATSVVSCGGYAACVSSTSGLVAYWRFNDTSGTTVTDETGNYSCTRPSFVSNNQAGRSLNGTSNNRAYTFGAPTSNWACGSITGNGTTLCSFSIEQWINTPGGTPAETDVPGSWNTNFWVHSSWYPYYGARYGNEGGVSTANYTAGWHHLVVTYAPSGSSNLNIYLDGVVSSRTISYSTPCFSNGKQLLFTHTDLGNPWYGYRGTADEIALYNRVLSASEVSAHYNAG